MIKMKIEMQDDILQQIISRLSILDGRTMPATKAAMKDAADYVRETWMGYVAGKTSIGIEPLKNPQGGLARTIRRQKVGPFNYEVYSDSKIMGYLIDGTDEVDMKETHTRGPRSRVSKKGVPYVIVPFRWGTPKTVGFRNVMPAEVYSDVKKMSFKKSVVTGDTHIEPNAMGDPVERQEYDWGSRLDMEGSNMDGMVRMKGHDGKAAGYFTFRVISRDSPAGSWIKPATQGKPITQGVVNATRKGVNELIDAAFRRDLGL
jgi:hypothetical protein